MGTGQQASSPEHRGRPTGPEDVGLPVGQLAAAGATQPGGASVDPTKPDTFIGQHILLDPEVIRQTVELIPEGALCVEIGPGPGTLTRPLVERGNPVVAYEVDERWEQALAPLVAGGNLTVRWGSFTDADERELNASRFHLVGNIPFHISEPLMKQMVGLNFVRAILLVGDRLAQALTVANPSQAGWSRMSMYAQAYFDVARVRDVPRRSFDPVPRADGALISMTPKDAGQSRGDAITRTYRALIEADSAHSTVAAALRRVVIDDTGRLMGLGKGGRPDKGAKNRAERSNVREGLRSFKNDYNANGEARRGGRQRDLMRAGEDMYTIVSRTVDPDILSVPLHAVDNVALREICGAISSAVNRRTKRRP